jgi:hypothetical protein
MGTRTVAFAAFALVVALLIAPAGLSAKDKRGARLLVTKLDGKLSEGELIAVKPDSLLLLSEGKDVSIGRADIQTVVIIRKSRALLFALIGGAAGAVPGAAVGLYKGGGDDEAGPAAIRGGVVFGAAGALAGLLANSLFTRDSHFDVAGKPEADVARFWERLSAHSREGARPKIAPALAPASARGEETSVGRKGRFKLSVSAAIPLSIANTAPDERVGYGSFSFPDEAAPESGPYVCGLNGWSSSGPVRVGPGPVDLAYEWTPHVSIDAEFFTYGRSSCRWDGTLGFASSLDGRWYTTGFGQGYDIRFSSVLLGLSYHPLVRDSLQPHDIEVGAAAGPAWIKGTPFGSDVGGPVTLPSVGKAGFSGRILAAYDFYFTTALSLGLFAGYRLMETHLTGTEASGTLAFWEGGDPSQTVVFQRLTEVSLPPLTVKATGLYAGLRIAFRI